MKKIGKREIIILVVSIAIFLISLVWFCIKGVPDIIKPKIYYRTYTKEKGWSEWSENGEVSGNKYDITAIQIKVKNINRKSLYYKTYSKNNWEKDYKLNNEISGNKKDGIKEIKIKLSDKMNKKYIVKYRMNVSKKKWYDFVSDDIAAFAKINKQLKLEPCKYIQIKIEKRK